MAEEQKDVKPEESQASSESTETKEQSEEASEGVKTPEDVVDKSVYEKVREAMKSEREQRKQKDSELTELQAKIEKLEQSRQSEEQTSDYDPYKAKTDILFMMNKDPFVKDNLDLVEEKMTGNPNMDVQSAVQQVKADFFDRIEKEVSNTESNKPLKQEKPTATEEQTPPKTSGNVWKDAISGKVDIDPEQLAAIRRQLPRQ